MIAMGVSKVVYGTTVLVDLTEDTVTPETLTKGVTAHNAKGELIVGTMEGGEPSAEESSIFDPTKETILTRSTATYKDIFVTKTIIAYVNTGKYAGYVGCKFDATIGETYRISWDKISTTAEYVFYYESDTILTKVDDHYGTRLYPGDNPFTFTATKPYVYIWVAHPSAPSTAELVLVTGLMVHKI